MKAFLADSLRFQHERNHTDSLSGSREIGCAIEVHRYLGTGLLESAYEQCWAHELSRNNIVFQRYLAQSIRHKDVVLDCG